jgi:hypothetical protein
VAWLVGTGISLTLGLKVFMKTSRVRSKAYIAQSCANNHGRYLALAEYRSGFRIAFIIILKGRERRG